MAALSHVSFVIGLGSSCSQPLLAKRPSRTAGSLRKLISNPCTDEIRLPPSPSGFGGPVKPDPTTAALAAADTDAVRGANAVFGMTPSWSHLRHLASNSGVSAL